MIPAERAIEKYKPTMPVHMPVLTPMKDVVSYSADFYTFNGIMTLVINKIVNGEFSETITIVHTGVHAYARCKRCDLLYGYISPDGYCKECL